MCEGIACTTPVQIIQIFAALTTIAIAAIVAFITFQQWKTNQATLREKLFERRFEIFRETQAFLTMLTGNDGELDVKIWKFTDVCQRSRFLFGSGVSDYLEKIRLRAIDTQFQQDVMRTPQHHADSLLQIHKYNEGRKWYFAQLKTIFVVFGPYLSFEKHK